MIYIRCPFLWCTYYGFDKCIMGCIHHYSTIHNSFTALKYFVLCRFIPLYHQTTHLFTVSIVLSFPKYHVVGIIRYVIFSNLILSFSNRPLSFLHIFSWLNFFLALNNIPLPVCTTVYPLNYWKVFRFFHVLAIMSRAAINIHVQVFMWT